MSISGTDCHAVTKGKGEAYCSTTLNCNLVSAMPIYRVVAHSSAMHQLTWPAVQVMGSPNSSYVWIQFMAHLVSLGQLDAARAVAERALATINFRCAIV